MTVNNEENEMKFLLEDEIKTKNIVYNEVENSFNPTEEIIDLIENGWEEKTKEMIEKGNFFYNGPLVRFENFEEKEDMFVINISKGIFYKNVVGLRYWNCEKYNNYKNFELPNALSIYNFVITKDDKLIIKNRGNVGDWENVLEVPGGFVRLGEFNPYDSSLKRLAEDLKLGNDNVENQTLLQITDHVSIAETPMMIQVKLNLNSDEIQTSSLEKIYFIENTIEAIDKLLEMKVKLHKPSFLALKCYKKLLLEKIENKCL